MGRVPTAFAFRTTGDGRSRAVASTVLVVAFVLPSAGCGASPPAATGSVESADAVAPPEGDGSGLMLPPDFKPVAVPLETRKAIFKEAHDIRALAVQEANQELPMDEASLPIGDTAAFDKRVADHKAIINRVLARDLPPLAEKYKISVTDVEKVEEEANRLRWLPPQDPVLDVKKRDPGGTKRTPEANPETQGDPRTGKADAKSKG